MFRDTFVTDGDISNDDFHDMAEAWIDIEDNEDMINEIVDDELLLVDAIVNDKNLDDVDNEDNEEEEIVQFATSTEKKRKHVEVLEVFATIESFLAQNKLPREHQLSLSKIRYGVQTHIIHKPKKSTTIRSFF